MFIYDHICNAVRNICYKHLFVLWAVSGGVSPSDHFGTQFVNSEFQSSSSSFFFLAFFSASSSASSFFILARITSSFWSSGSHQLRPTCFCSASTAGLLLADPKNPEKRTASTPNRNEVKFGNNRSEHTIDPIDYSIIRIFRSIIYFPL